MLTGANPILMLYGITRSNREVNLDSMFGLLEQLAGQTIAGTG